MERQGIRTERTHFMCPNMHFGILAAFPAAFDERRAASALDALAEARPFLRAVVAYEPDGERLYYRIGDQSRVAVRTFFDDTALWQFFDSLSDQDWNVFENGLLKVCFCPTDAGFRALFAAHHLLGDGRCVLELVRAFARAYHGETLTVAPERLIRDIGDLPEGSDLAGVSRLLVSRANRLWRKEHHRVSYAQYAAFARQYARENPVSTALATADASRVEAMHRLCRENGFTVNDFLLAKAFLATNAKKIIIAVDIRERLPGYRKDAAGNYATAVGIARPYGAHDPVGMARAVGKRVRAALHDNRRLMTVLSCYLRMDETLLDAAAIAALGGLDSKAARFVGGGMFGFSKGEGVSVTNLGAVDDALLAEATFIPPASPAAKATVGVLTVHGEMRLCCRFAARKVGRDEATRLLETMASV